MIGETVREFEIQSELGAGGYGAVYRAHDISVNRDVAIKVILPKYANDPDFQQRFEHEAQLVAQLESRQIVPLYSYWQDERGAFLVMRYIRGGSLRRIIAKQDALSLSQTVRIVADIAEALAVAHENDVVHRDLKPENILIDERGNAYLTDFGIAKRTTETENITDADVIVGTWAYLSPEQIQSTAVSPQTDIYAFGIMLYEMLVGKHPFQSVPAPAMLMKHLQESLPSICDERPDLPAQLDSIIQKATAKNPQDRYASTLDLLADLKMVANVSNTKATLQVKQVRKKTSGTPEERNRQAMLENVRSFWIAGVLENSLHDAAMIELGLKAESGKVDNPWDTLLRTPDGEESITNENILEVFDRMNGKLLILGDPGSGKTTTLLMLARELLHRAEIDDHHPIPVVFNLSSWSEKQPPLTEWLVDELNSKYQVPRKVGEKWITDEELLLLLDGLDEVAADTRDACVTAINDYREQHGFVDVVVCSRIKDYDVLHNQLRLKGAIVIQPLDDEQIVAYLDGLGSDVLVVRELINSDAQLRELAQSPLMLSIMILAYRGKTVTDIPDFSEAQLQRQHLFEIYINRMFERRFGIKPYSQGETLHYLSWLAQQMLDRSLTLFHIEGLQPFWFDKNHNRRYRRNFYFSITVMYTLVYAVTYLLLLPLMPNVAQQLNLELPFSMSTIWFSGGILGFLIGNIVASGLFAKWSGAVLAGICFGVMSLTFISSAGIRAWFLGIGFVFVGSLAYYIGGLYHRRLRRDSGFERIVILEKANWVRENIKWQFILFGFLTGFIGTTTLTLTFNTEFPSLSRFIPAVVITSTVTTLLFSGNSGLSFSELDLRHRPNQGIWRSLSNANRIIFAQIIGLLAYLPGIWFVLPITPGIAVLIISILYFVFGSWMIFGGFTVFQHATLRFVLYRDGLIPRNMAHFLDSATALILLRKVGGGYIFIHRYLLEYFAALYRGKLV